MRSAEIFRALDRISNRYTLCQVTAQSARMLHKNGCPMKSSLSDALQGVHAGKFRGESRAPTPALPIQLGAEVVLFGLPHSAVERTRR